MEIDQPPRDLDAVKAQAVALMRSEGISRLAKEDQEYAWEVLTTYGNHMLIFGPMPELG